MFARFPTPDLVLADSQSLGELLLRQAEGQPDVPDVLGRRRWFLHGVVAQESGNLGNRDVVLPSVALEFPLGHRRGIDFHELGGFGPGQAEAFAVAAEFLADGLAGRSWVVAEESDDAGPSPEVRRAVAVLPVLDCRLVDADSHRNLALQELQVQSALAQVLADGLRLARIAIRLWF